MLDKKFLSRPVIFLFPFINSLILWKVNILTHFFRDIFMFQTINEKNYQSRDCHFRDSKYSYGKNDLQLLTNDSFSLLENVPNSVIYARESVLDESSLIKLTYIATFFEHVFTFFCSMCDSLISARSQGRR